MGIIKDTPQSRSALRRDAYGILGAIAVALLVWMLPAPSGLSVAAQRTAALFGGVLVLLSTEALPMAVTGVLAVMLQPILGLKGLGPAISSFMNPIFFFLVAVFAIAFAWVKTGLARRFALWMVSIAGTDAKRAVYVFVIGTGLMSTLLSDLACTAIFMAIALPIFDKLKLVPGRSTFAKAVMIGIPIASLIGGVGTPVGASSNALGLLMIEQNGGPPIHFLNWMAIGIPMVMILLPVTAWVLTIFYPPEIETIGNLEEIRQERRQMGPISGNEWKVVGLMSAMLVLWIFQFDTVLVASCGALAMFLPGFRLFTWKEVQSATGWDSIMMIGGVTSLGAVSVSSGLAKWLVGSSIGGMQNLGPISLLALVGLFTVGVHLLLPINPVIPAVIIPPIMALGTTAGHNPALFALPAAFTASCSFLLPLDAVPGLTYSEGYYHMFDMLVPGVILSIAWIVVLTGLLSLIGPLVGLG